MEGSCGKKTRYFIAKNYLTEDEIDTLNRLVIIFLETAELRAKNKEQISMKFWKQNVDRILEFNDKKILNSQGKISHAQMEQKTKDIYALFDKKRKELEAQQTDLKELEELNNTIKNFLWSCGR